MPDRNRIVPITCLGAILLRPCHTRSNPLVLLDLARAKSGRACLPRQARQPGKRAPIYDLRDCGWPLACSLAALSNRVGRSPTGGPPVRPSDGTDIAGQCKRDEMSAFRSKIIVLQGGRRNGALPYKSAKAVGTMPNSRVAASDSTGLSNPRFA